MRRASGKWLQPRLRSVFARSCHAKYVDSKSFCGWRGNFLFTLSTRRTITRDGRISCYQVFVNKPTLDFTSAESEKPAQARSLSVSASSPSRAALALCFQVRTANAINGLLARARTRGSLRSELQPDSTLVPTGDRNFGGKPRGAIAQKLTRKSFCAENLCPLTDE